MLAASLHTASAMNALRRIVRALRAGHTAARGSLGVSAAQLFVLRVVGHSPGLTLAAICDATATTQSSASEVVTRLVEQGLVMRGVAVRDRRRVALALSAEGRRIVRDGPETVQERLVAGYERMSDEDQCAVARGLHAWVTSAGLSETPATMFLEP